jgi:hypothetical protein
MSFHYWIIGGVGKMDLLSLQVWLIVATHAASVMSVDLLRPLP